MRTFLYLCAMLGLIFSFSSAALAGDYADLKFIGFSKDGRYLAFEESGTYDGGADYSTTYFVDVVKNTYALPPVEINEGGAFTTADKKVEAATNKKLRLTLAANLRRLKIVEHNTGDLLVAHLLTDFTYDNYQKTQDENTETVTFNYFIYTNMPSDGDFQLILKHLPVTNPGKQNCDATNANMLELTLENKWSDGRNASQILQKDTLLPKSRWCPFYYRIERVYFYGDKIAVFLNYFNQGFEGTSMRYMVVTAQMEAYKLNNQ